MGKTPCPLPVCSSLDTKRNGRATAAPVGLGRQLQPLQRFWCNSCRTTFTYGRSKPTLVLRNAAFPLYFPDGREIAFVEPTPSNFEGYRIAIANADGHDGGRRTLVEAGGPIWWPAMSPDGSRIVYQVGDYSLHVVDVSTGESSKVADGESADWVDGDTLIVNPG